MKVAVIHAWAMPSASSDEVYETLLRADGSLECPCRGWIFKRHGQERGCKHTREVGAQAQVIHEKYQRGELVGDGVRLGRVPQTVAVRSSGAVKIRRAPGREAELAAVDNDRIRFLEIA